jgi:hypothetical protein
MVRRLNLSMPRPVGLETLVEHAALMHRTDRKYIAPVEAVAALIAEISDTHRVLQIKGRHYTTYRTLYFDTVDFESAKAHIQRRRKRWKVRSRLYVEDQLCRVEVKTKDNRGNTVKVMGISEPERYGTLTGEDRDFVEFHLSDFPETDVADLVPATEICYSRATLSDLEAGTRVTIDWGLTAHLENGDVWLDDQIALVETKGPAALSRVDHTLYQLGVRPRGFSKYVTAASSLVPDIASNDVRSLQSSGIVHYRALEF